MKPVILFPSSYFDRRKIDEDLQEEYDAATTSGFETVLFGYDDWFNNGIIKLYGDFTPQPLQPSMLYRGWMMLPKQYTDFYNKLCDQGILLVTEPKQYEMLHCFPNAYCFIKKEDTCRIKLFPGDRPKPPVKKITSLFDKFIIKDYVKSTKGTEFPEYFTKDTTQEEFDKAMDIFYKYRGDLFTGGICAKEYLDLYRDADGHTNEYRTFYFNEEPLITYGNSGQWNSDLPHNPPDADLIDRYSICMPSLFYTVDIAELSDHSWKIIETGDGGVSGISNPNVIKNFYTILYNHCQSIQYCDNDLDDEQDYDVKD